MNPSRTKGDAQPHLSRSSDGEVRVRMLESHAERDTCVRLQRAIWGPSYEDVVPASILKVSQNVGGVAAGAFLNGDELVGFVYGMTGIRGGRLTHWSHMLGVLSDHRGRGIGQQLKLFQRQWLVDRGVEEMRWTFDPLVSGNADFNMNVLGVRIHRYVVDMYGDTGSGLHSFGTDRFVAHWELTERVGGVGPELVEPVDWDQAPLLNPETTDGDGAGRLSDPAPRAARIVIPYDIVSLAREEPRAAQAWRASTRAAFQAGRDDGYEVVGFTRSLEAARGHYLLVHSSLVTP
jgi:chorismate synthase